jgi:hypothetical protein
MMMMARRGCSTARATRGAATSVEAPMVSEACIRPRLVQVLRMSIILSCSVTVHTSVAFRARVTQGRRPADIWRGRSPPSRSGGPIHALLEAGFGPAGHVDIHRGDIDAVIDHMLKDAGTKVRPQAFVFDRQAAGKLVLSLWRFVRQDCGLITRSDGGGDIRLTIDFSHVTPPAHLDAQVELLKLKQVGGV